MIRAIQNSSAEAAKTYFSDALAKADYYINDQELTGLFGGRLAQRLGLKKEVTQKQFYDLCDNISPLTGDSLTPETRDGRTVFYDINFHVSKSVSIVHALSKDNHILNAFQESVRATMAEIEADSLTRVRIGGRHEDRKSGELVYAEFIHQTARPVPGFTPDPHLHAHMVVFNASYDPTEQRIKACQFREIKRNMPYYTQIFQKHLADKLQDMGYDIRRTKHAFEIVGVPEKAVALFSKRKGQIEKVAKELGITNENELAALGARTRAAKDKGMSMSELKADWIRQIHDNGIEAEPENSIRYGYPESKDLITPDKCVDHAITHSFERSSVKAERRVLAEAIRHSIGSRFTNIQSVKNTFYADERLIRVDGAQFTECTTKDVLNEEMQMVNLAQKGFGCMKPLYKEAPSLELDTQQANAVGNILTSFDRVNIIRGAAGSGKTTLMREAVKQINKAGKQVFAVAPTSEASRDVLRKEGFTNATTVATLLGDIKNQDALRGQVIWCDEAGLLSNKEMIGLLKLAEQKDAQLILAGDTRQHSSVARGDALRILNTVGNVPVAEVNKIYRQKKHDYRNAIENIAHGNMIDGFKKLDDIGFIKTIDPREPHKQLVIDYITSVKAGKKALVISPTHKQGDEVTREIREVLRNEKMIGKQEITIRKLTGLNLTEAEKSDWRNFKEGQVVQFNLNAKGIPKGSAWKVKGTTDSYISIEGKDGKTRSLPLDKPLSYDVFEEKDMPISKGDKIKITRNGVAERKRSPNMDAYLTLYSKKQKVEALQRKIKRQKEVAKKQRPKSITRYKEQLKDNQKILRRLSKQADNKIQVNNGQMLEVVSLNKDGKIELKTTDGKSRYLLNKDFGHLTHAHCITSHASQGKTVDRVFIYQPSSTFEATTDKQFYVSASRGREKAVFYTDDKKGLLDHVTELSERQSAIELVSRHKDHSEWVLHQERSQPNKHKTPEPGITPRVKRARFEDRDYEPGF